MDGRGAGGAVRRAAWSNNDIKVFSSPFVHVDDVLICLCGHCPPNQEGASAGVEGLNGGLLHEALRDPAEAAGRQTLPRGTSGALGRSDRPEEQRKDQQALKDLEVWQRSRKHSPLYAPAAVGTGAAPRSHCDL